MSDAIMKRPKSEDLADLHVFIVPIESWLGKYSVAYNSVALQSTSAGFIRVYQHATLSNIRDLMKEQLESTVIPNEYVFLRSVGRCMAVVNKNQEKQLRAKHFLPPIAYSPEIFLLPGTHEWIASLRGKTTSIVINKDNSTQDEFGRHHSRGYGGSASEDIAYFEQVTQQNSNTDIEVVENEERERHNKATKITETAVGPDDLENRKNEHTDSSEMLAEQMHSSRDPTHFSKILKELKRPTSQNPSSRKSSSESNSGDDENPTAIDKTSPNELKKAKSDTNPPFKAVAEPTIQVIHPEILTHPASYGRVPTPTPIPSANIVHSTLKYSHLEKANNDVAKTNTTTQIESIVSTESYQKEQENYEADTGESSIFTPSKEDEEKDVSMEDRSASKSPLLASEYNLTNEANDLSKNNRYNDELKIRNKNLKDEIRKREDNKKLEEEKLKLEDKKRSMENETLELMKGMEELLQKKKEEEERRRKEEEERKRKFKQDVDRKKEEVVRSREMLIHAKQQRAEKQKQREELVREAKEIKTKIYARKSPEKSLWQRKYEKEKEGTSNLEEELSSVKEELSSHQKKLMNGLEGKGPFAAEEEKSSSRLTIGPSQLNNLKNEVRRCLNDIQRMKEDLEKTKGLLTIESKKKIEAQKELKDLRSQVNEKRKTITLSKVERDQAGPQRTRSNSKI